MMNKTDKLQNEVIKIINNSKDIFEAFTNYHDFMLNQTYIKNKKSANKNCTFIVMWMLSSLNKYLSKVPDKLLFEHEYVEVFNNYVYYWYYQLLYKEKCIDPEYKIIAWLGVCERILKKRYKELFPNLAKANECLLALLHLDKVNMPCEALEHEFKVLTNNYSPSVISNLPFIVNILNRKE